MMSDGLGSRNTTQGTFVPESVTISWGLRHCLTLADFLPPKFSALSLGRKESSTNGVLAYGKSNKTQRVKAESQVELHSQKKDKL